MATSSGFHFDASKFESPKVMEVKLLRAVKGTMEYWDGPIETHMKHHAPWRDRTTNARNGLFAVAKKASKYLFVIVLGHIVDYGVYLEEGTQHAKAYPIIGPTITEYAPKVIGTLTKILDRLG